MSSAKPALEKKIAPAESQAERVLEPDLAMLKQILLGLNSASPDMLVDMQNEHGETRQTPVICWAAAHGYKFLVENLCGLGANLDVKDAVTGLSPTELATINGHTEVAAILEREGEINTELAESRSERLFTGDDFRARVQQLSTTQIGRLSGR